MCLGCISKRALCLPPPPHTLDATLTLGLAELTFRTREMGEYTFRFFEAFTAATLVYIAIAMTANRVMALIERRTAVPGYIAGGK